MLVGVIIQGKSPRFDYQPMLTATTVVPGVNQGQFIGGRFLVGFG